MRPRGALLVGSVPLDSAESVLRACADNLGNHLSRIPDGETGERSQWIVYQSLMLAKHPDFQEEARPAGYGSKEIETPPTYRVRDGISPGDVTFPNLGYAENAKASYETFRRLRDGGSIAEHIRFQVALPTPLAPIVAFVVPRDQAAIEPAYRAAMLRELAEIYDAIPAEELTIQWDVCNEVGIWEEVGPPCEAWFDNPREGTLDRIGALMDAVPQSVEVGLHLCYGDFGHQHFVEPADTGIVVAMANGILERCARPIDYVHLPVPRDRDDETYFEPLRSLRLPAETKLYLGLVHLTDGVPGANRRIATAQRFVPDFGVATECGFGRRPAVQVEPLLRLHAEVSESLTTA